MVILQAYYFIIFCLKTDRVHSAKRKSLIRKIIQFVGETNNKNVKNQENKHVAIVLLVLERR